MGSFDSSIQNSLTGRSKIIEDDGWEYKKSSFRKGSPAQADFEIVGRTFHTADYKCPECGKYMLQANAGGYITVQTSQTPHILKSVFACFNCRKIYSARAGHPLSDGECYVMTEKSRFEHVTDMIDKYGVCTQYIDRSNR